MASTSFSLVPHLNAKTILPLSLAAVLFISGLIAVTADAWAYGLLLLATLTLLAGLIATGFFFLTKRFDTAALLGFLVAAFKLGAWGYVMAIAALSGHFAHETLQGRMEFKWIVFGPVALIALLVLEWGLYRIIFLRNLPTWQRYRHVMSRQMIDEKAMQRTLVDEVVLHRSLYRTSKFRWVRHQFILWGIGLMFAVEILAVFVREAVPAFGLRDIWEELDHPIRLAFDAAFDVTGLMILLGCILALIYRLRVNGQPDQKYTDTPTAVFLLFVVLSGFIVEGMRLAALPSEAFQAASPVGSVFAMLFSDGGSDSEGWLDAVWLIHVLASCAFIAYVPVKRLIHSCATPLGRLMHSQKTMLAAKKDTVLRGLFRGS